LDFFDIGKLIGKGKFSNVHLCTEKVSKKKWAVKIIQKSSLTPEDKSLLRTEISILRIVNHPYIISLRDVYENHENVFLVMTLTKGGDLFDALKAKDFKIEEIEAKTIVFKILEALTYLRDFGIVHRDLKTENILVREKTNPMDIMLTDFGLSKFSGPQEVMLKKVGTVAYVAPEVLLGNGYSQKVDLWSLGCIMHLLLGGYLPFDAKNEDKIRERILLLSVRFSNSRWSSISKEAKDLLKSLLVKKPRERIDLESAKMHDWFSDLDLFRKRRGRMASISKECSPYVKRTCGLNYSTKDEQI